MARSDSERLARLLDIRDLIDDALYASAGNADVVEYTTQDGRKVTRSRISAHNELEKLERQIAMFERRVNGRSVNRVSLRRRP